MALQVITPPATTPVTLAQLKKHLRVTFDDDDAIIEIYNKAATGAAEQFMGRALIDQVVEFTLDSFPTDELAIQLPWPKIIELVGVFYSDGDGNEIEMPVDDYYVDRVNEPGWISPVTSSWPATLDAINAVRIRYRAGYLNSDSPPVENVPSEIKAAIMLTAGSLYAHRETIVVGQSAVLIPWGAEQLLRPYKINLSMA